jgi:hypothetical protein
VQIDNLKDVGIVVDNKNNNYWVMQNGYAMPAKGRRSFTELATRLNNDAELVKQAEAALRVGVHWNTSVIPPLEHRVCQVFASALPCAYAPGGPPLTDWEPFARLVLRSAYEATLAIAALKWYNNNKPDERVKCYITTLGGGVFGNRSEWIVDAITNALNKYNKYPIDVILVHFGTNVDTHYNSIPESVARPVQVAIPGPAPAPPRPAPPRPAPAAIPTPARPAPAPAAIPTPARPAPPTPARPVTPTPARPAPIKPAPFIFDKCKLTNIGNSCFLNAAMHFLFNIDSLRLYLHNITYEDIQTLKIYPYISYDIADSTIELYRKNIKALKRLFFYMEKNSIDEASSKNPPPIKIDEYTTALDIDGENIFDIFARFIAFYQDDVKDPARKYSRKNMVQLSTDDLIRDILDIFKNFMYNDIYKMYQTCYTTMYVRSECTDSNTGIVYSTPTTEQILSLDLEPTMFKSTISETFKEKCKIIKLTLADNKRSICTSELHQPVDSYGKKVYHPANSEQNQYTTFRESNTLIIKIPRQSNHKDPRQKNRMKIEPDKKLIISGKTYTLQGCIVHISNTASGGHYVYVVFDKHGNELYVLNDDSINQAGSVDVNLDGFLFLYKELNKSSLTAPPLNIKPKLLVRPKFPLIINNYGHQLDRVNKPNLSYKPDYKYNFRKFVLQETLDAFANTTTANHYYDTAEKNIQHWSSLVKPTVRSKSLSIIVEDKDWGVMVYELSKKYGTTFVCLNMSNSNHPGGGYAKGSGAQEENMFRRTNCHFTLERNSVIESKKNHKGQIKLMYLENIRKQIAGETISAYLDMEKPRICIRGPEIITRNQVQGYEFLKDDEICPFYEMRIAAVNNKYESDFDEFRMDKLIKLQFQTLKQNNVRHVILGAFGCGGFNNPPERVACLYRKYLQIYEADFDVIGFPIYYAGHGANNFDIFNKALTFLQLNTIQFTVNETGFILASQPFVTLPDIDKDYTKYGSGRFIEVIQKSDYTKATITTTHTDDEKTIIRKWVIHDTLKKFETNNYHIHAQNNITRWVNDKAKQVAIGPCKIFVEKGDWGATTLKYTKQYGKIFACLNMANALTFGGGYIKGSPAQEENMFRRTDCHFSNNTQDGHYTHEMQDLINGVDGRVYFDWRNPRVCIKGEEDSNKKTLGYELLGTNDIFPFYELRTAAIDLRPRNDGHPANVWDEENARARIVAQLETLIVHKVQYAILGAFGCGAFLNNPADIAKLYKEEIEYRKNHFKVIVFPIYVGYDNNDTNYKAFRFIAN